jgi:sulfur carrier protein ThiS
MNDDSSYDKLEKTIKNFNDYLAKIKKEVDLNEHSLAIHYDYDIVPLPDDIIDKANKIEREK